MKYIKKEITLVLVVSIMLLTGCKSAKETESVEALEIGQIAEIKNQRGDILYTLVIQNVEEVDDYMGVDELSNYEQVTRITYRYDNINSDTKIRVDGLDLTVVDSQDVIAKYIHTSPEDEATEVPKGVGCVVESYYALRTESEEIKVYYEANVSTQTTIYSLPILKIEKQEQTTLDIFTLMLEEDISDERKDDIYYMLKQRDDISKIDYHGNNVSWEAFKQDYLGNTSREDSNVFEDALLESSKGYYEITPEEGYDKEQLLKFLKSLDGVMNVNINVEMN